MTQKMNCLERLPRGKPITGHLRQRRILARRVGKEHRPSRLELQKLLETTGVRPKLVRELFG